MFAMKSQVPGLQPTVQSLHIATSSAPQYHTRPHGPMDPSTHHIHKPVANPSSKETKKRTLRDRWRRNRARDGSHTRDSSLPSSTAPDAHVHTGRTQDRRDALSPGTGFFSPRDGFNSHKGLSPPVFAMDSLSTHSTPVPGSNSNTLSLQVEMLEKQIQLLQLRQQMHSTPSHASHASHVPHAQHVAPVHPAHPNHPHHAHHPHDPNHSIPPDLASHGYNAFDTHVLSLATHPKDFQKQRLQMQVPTLRGHGNASAPLPTSAETSGFMPDLSHLDQEALLFNSRSGMSSPARFLAKGAKNQNNLQIGQNDQNAHQKHLGRRDTNIRASRTRGTSVSSGGSPRGVRVGRGAKPRGGVATGYLVHLGRAGRLGAEWHPYGDESDFAHDARDTDHSQHSHHSHQMDQMDERSDLSEIETSYGKDVVDPHKGLKTQLLDAGDSKESHEAPAPQTQLATSYSSDLNDYEVHQMRHIAHMNQINENYEMTENDEIRAQQAGVVAVTRNANDANDVKDAKDARDAKDADESKDGVKQELSKLHRRSVGSSKRGKGTDRDMSDSAAAGGSVASGAESTGAAPRAWDANYKISSAVKDVLSFWFKGTFEETINLWFSKSPRIDAEITEKFGKLVAQAREGKLDDWVENVWSGLALVVLLDQFPRNMFRHDKKMYASDEKACQVVSCLLYSGAHHRMSPLHCVSLCLVLTHSESLLLQKLCLKLWRDVSVFVPNESPLGMFDGIFKKHFDVIEKFGRFPHRNDIFGRQTNEKEKEFLRLKSFRFDLPLKQGKDGKYIFERTESFANAAAAGAAGAVRGMPLKRQLTHDMM